MPIPVQSTKTGVNCQLSRLTVWKQIIQQGYTYGSIHENVYLFTQISSVLLSA